MGPLWDTLGPLWGLFGVVLGSFWGHIGVTLCALGSLWGHFEHMSVTFESHWSICKKHSFPPTILMILCNCRVNFGTTLALKLRLHLHFHALWGRLGHSGVTLGSLWGRFGAESGSDPILGGSICRNHMFRRAVCMSQRSGPHRTSPQIIANRRTPDPRNSKRYQFANPCD